MSSTARGLSHVNVTLRDAQTHDPIGNAEVEVRVTNPVMGAESRKLVRTTAGGVVSYGGEFRITGREAHVVTVRIRRPQAAGTIETRFDYKG